MAAVEKQLCCIVFYNVHTKIHLYYLSNKTMFANFNIFEFKYICPAIFVNFLKINIKINKKENLTTSLLWFLPVY